MASKSRDYADFKISQGLLTYTYIDKIKETIFSYFLLGPNHFPFNPHRGIDLESYIFESQDEQFKTIMQMRLQDRLRAIDRNLVNITLDIYHDDIYESRVDIGLIFKDGTKETISI